MEIAIAVVGAIVTVGVIAAMVRITRARSVPVRTSLDEHGENVAKELSPREPGAKT